MAVIISHAVENVRQGATTVSLANKEKVLNLVQSVGEAGNAGLGFGNLIVSDESGEDFPRIISLDINGVKLVHCILELSDHANVRVNRLAQVKHVSLGSVADAQLEIALLLHRHVVCILADDNGESSASDHCTITTVTPQDIHRAVGLAVRGLELLRDFHADKSESAVIH